MNFEDMLSQLSDLEDDSPMDDEPATLDLNVIQSNLPIYDVKRVCEMVVCERYFGLDKQIGLMCMQELARRRAAGDTFDFESYIDQSYKELPVLQLGNIDLRSVLGSLISPKGK
jgi:hypothetical protein